MPEKAVEISTSQVLDFMKFAGDGHSLAFNSVSSLANPYSEVWCINSSKTPAFLQTVHQSIQENDALDEHVFVHGEKA